MPVYNGEEFLHRSINSVLEQTEDDIELIIINDGSKDKTEEICNEYAKNDSRVKVIHQKNLGQARARNKGLELAQGKYIGFIDSDDWIVKDMYEYLIDLIESNGCDIAQVDYYPTKKYIESIERNIKVTLVDKENILRTYLYEGMKYRISWYPVWNKIYKAELLKDIRFGKISLCEDYLINFKIFSNCSKIVKSNKVGYFYFQHPSSTIHGKLEHSDLDLLVNCREVEKLAKGLNDLELELLAREKIARCYFSLILKGKLYGIDDNLDKKYITFLKENLNREYLTLLKSSMPINRKLIMTLLCICNYFEKLLSKFK